MTLKAMVEFLNADAHKYRAKRTNNMNFFKLFLPKENQQVVTELESWTVSWGVSVEGSYDYSRYSKVFIKIEEAQEFERQLKEQAKFVGCCIKTKLYKN